MLWSRLLTCTTLQRLAFVTMYVHYRLMNWHVERMEHRDVGPGEDDEIYGDHFDGSNWEQKFCKDHMVAENGGPSSNIALEFCADGVAPFKKGAQSLWFCAMSMLNLPPWVRHTVNAMHLLFIVPGPKKPVRSRMHNDEFLVHWPPWRLQHLYCATFKTCNEPVRANTCDMFICTDTLRIFACTCAG